MSVSRREFLKTGGYLALGFAGVRSLTGCKDSALEISSADPLGLGPLRNDAAGILELPEGFRYKAISRAGQTMDDGLLVPSHHDGTGTFARADGTTVLVRNHEFGHTVFADSAFGPNAERLGKIDRRKLYDPGYGKPQCGGTTTLVFDTKKQELLSHRLSLAGTTMNCSGGVTPWGTWISCEETAMRAGEHKIDDQLTVRLEKDHGYAFEVPADPKAGLVDPIPIRAMGRFMHEAAVVHTRTGIVYMTEDVADGLIYRFIPDHPGQLVRGGKLQALALRDAPSADTSNAAESKTKIGERVAMAVRWIDLDDVEAPMDDLRHRGHADGAAKFSRGEGMWAGDEEIYFDSTTGGPQELGQIWRYVPSALEGTAAESREPGALELFVESHSRDLLTNSDNLTIAPWGDLIVCEDHIYFDERRTHLLGFTPDGEGYTIARNVMNTSELTGCVFSPDGTTLFVNIQRPGLTLAITGPWPAGA